jgi:hypothetical protein
MALIIAIYILYILLCALQDGTQLEDPLMKRSRMRQMASQAIQGGR